MRSPLTTIALLVGAGVSTLANYAGLSSTFPNNELWWLLFAAAIAGAVGAMIFAFWSAAIKAATTPSQLNLRISAWVGVVFGMALIIGISSYWNAVAIGAKPAFHAALSATATRAERALAERLEGAVGHRGLLPLLDSLAAETGRLAECEGTAGCVTGIPGTSGVYNVLVQMQSKADGLISTINEADSLIADQASEGNQCLTQMRRALADDDAAETSAATDCLNEVLANISSQNLAERIASAMDNYTVGVVLPITVSSDGQRLAVANILSGLQERADGIAGAAGATPSAVHEPITVNRMSPMKAVLVHWDAIIPSWITGIALDLFPLILLFFESVGAASKRNRPDARWHAFTVGDVASALSLSRALEHERSRASVDTAPAPSVVSSDKSPNGIQYRNDNVEAPYWEEVVPISKVNQLPKGWS